MSASIAPFYARDYLSKGETVRSANRNKIVSSVCFCIFPPDTRMNAPAEFARAVCPHDCPDTCAMRITVKDGRAVKVTGDPDHPPTQGVLCTKVSRYAERTHHRDRLLTPMRRVGAKGEGRFEAVSWDEALTFAAESLNEIAIRAPEAILPYR